MIQTSSFDDVMTDAKHVAENGCYDYTINGECSKCGSCCSAILPLQKSEIVRLKQLIKVKGIKPHKQLNVLARASIMIDLTCPFLTENHQCSIYDERPFICKVFKCDSKPSYSDFESLKEPLISTDVRTFF